MKNHSLEKFREINLRQMSWFHEFFINLRGKNYDDTVIPPLISQKNLANLPLRV